MIVQKGVGKQNCTVTKANPHCIKVRKEKIKKNKCSGNIMMKYMTGLTIDFQFGPAFVPALRKNCSVIQARNKYWPNRGFF